MGTVEIESEQSLSSVNCKFANRQKYKEKKIICLCSVKWSCLINS